jgi:hypothetical protein
MPPEKWLFFNFLAAPRRAEQNRAEQNNREELIG